MSAPGNKRRTSDRDHWETPRAVYDPLYTEFCFQIDPCTSEANNLNALFWRTAETTGVHDGPCGLCTDWYGPWFMNPPYSNVREWVEHGIEQAPPGVMLLPNATETAWFRRVFDTADEIRFVTKRIQFEVNGKRPLNPKTGKPSGNTGGSILAVYHPGHQRRHCGNPRTSLWTWEDK